MQPRNDLTRSSEGESELNLVRSKQFWLPCLLVFHLLILLHAGQWYVLAVFAGQTPRPLTYLAWSLKLWYTRALLVPPVILLVRRYPFDLRRWFRSSLFYLACTLGIAFLGSAVQAVTVERLQTETMFLHTSVEDHPQLTDFQRAIIRGWPHLIYNAFTCWMLIALVQGVKHYRELRDKDLQAARLQAQLATLRLEALRMQLNPHFLFNALHAVSSLIEEQPHVAEEMLLGLGELLRTILDDGAPEITLRRELSFVECYLSIERIRFGKRLSTKISVQEALLDCTVPQLILQPLVENAIKHGIGKHAGDDQIHITIYEEHNQLCVEIKNHKGSLSGSRESSRPGVGIANTTQRLSTLYSQGASLSLHALRPQGVTARMLIPIRTTFSRERETIRGQEVVDACVSADRR